MSNHEQNNEKRMKELLIDKLKKKVTYILENSDYNL